MPFSGCPLTIAAHAISHIPKFFQFLRDNGVHSKDVPGGKVALQALQDDDIGRNDEEGFGVVLLGLFQNGVQVLPGNCQGHHLGFAGAGCHLDAVARKLVINERAHILWQRKGLQQGFAATRFSNFVDID